MLGFIIDSMEKTFRKHINSTLEDAKVIMDSAVSASSLHTVEEGVIPFWKEAYYSLVMIEKMVRQFPDLKLKKDSEVSTQFYETQCNRRLRDSLTIALNFCLITALALSLLSRLSCDLFSLDLVFF